MACAYDVMQCREFDSARQRDESAPALSMSEVIRQVFLRDPAVDDVLSSLRVVKGIRRIVTSVVKDPGERVLGERLVSVDCC